MRIEFVRVRGIKTGIAAAALVALCSWWSLPMVRKQMQAFLPTFSTSTGTDSRGYLDSPALAPSLGKSESWLKKAFEIPKPLDPKQQAMAHLEAAGMPFTGDGFVRAVETSYRPLVDLFLTAGMSVNESSSDGRTALLAATITKDWALVQHLLQLGADVNRADDNGLTPLMAAAMADHLPTMKALMERGAVPGAVDLHAHSALHYAVATKSIGALQELLRTGVDCTSSCCEGRDLLSHATETRDWRIVEPVLSLQPPKLAWNEFTRSELLKAMTSQDAAKAKLLISKHPAAPTPEGHAQPLLAYAIVSDNFRAFKFLLEAGADPNTPLDSPVSKDFSKRVSKGFLQHYLETESGMTALMLAAGLGRTDYVKALLDAGASRGLLTQKYRMPALLFATRTDSTEVSQMLIGSAPKPEQLRIQISLGAQRATIYKNGAIAFSTSVSTGRSGFSTPTGEFVVTDKHRHHISTIYKVPMPFFMRLNAKDFGMHQGVVPGYPASHGCIRVPSGTAQKLFAQIPVGTLVSITH
jgi:ankyrin repeat protein